MNLILESSFRIEVAVVLAVITIIIVGIITLTVIKLIKDKK